MNAEIGCIHSELLARDTTRSLAYTYWKRVEEAEAVVKDLAAKTNLTSPEDRRRAVEALLSGITVKTIGMGRDRRLELSFRWLIGQGSYKLVDIEDLGHHSVAAARLVVVRKSHATIVPDF